ncbi:hypothetical protein L1987_24395 [Smallanthus sonchifolius]|uniref:Uncharacterized protein n=1 Tax=Smallanthus sonchifolius TaxID=185202 RepID=A0ACB9IKI3_9ASTR|nr:hypothetical protein L1987_24395 [Smallanthus sonchifolius]
MFLIDCLLSVISTCIAGCFKGRSGILICFFANFLLFGYDLNMFYDLNKHGKFRFSLYSTFLVSSWP